MITVTGYQTKDAKDGKTFTVLELQGGLEMVQSSQTGKFYATVRKCTVTTTFDEMICKSLIGTQMVGRIARVECEPYEYTVESTGEVVVLTHRWSYLPENASQPMMEAVS